MTKRTVLRPHQRLGRWRRKVGKTQLQAAACVGVAQATWSRWEAGVLTPQLRFAIRLEAVTGIPSMAWVTASQGAA